MKTQKPSYLWTIPIGLFFPVAMTAIYYFRFGKLNPYSPFTDYLLFFLAGAAGAAVFFAFLHRSESKVTRGWVTAGYVIAFPFGLMGMLGGGLLGWIGVIIFAVLPWLVGSGLGYLLGKWIEKRKGTTA